MSGARPGSWRRCSCPRRDTRPGRCSRLHPPAPGAPRRAPSRAHPPAPGVFAPARPEPVWTGSFPQGRAPPRARRFREGRDHRCRRLRPRRPHRRVRTPRDLILSITVLALLASPALALEKSGRVEIEEGRPPDVQFSLSLSDFVDNSSFRARPDNTGIVKYRYLGHFEIQPHWAPLALVLDTNFFTDKDARNEFRLSEWDQAVGFLYRDEKWAGLLRYERDMPIDKSGLVQAFAEAQG